ncbi:MAG TPA: PH domain-containing protein [Candidatus Saccharibacteria bacterium]|nr:PH domain-containing protein [Candidatus Saccharibacteria bacterium]
MTNKEKIKKEQFDFEGQREGEKLLFVFRRHIIAMRKGFYLLLGVFLVASLPMLIWGLSVEYDIFIKLLYLACGGFLLGLILFFYHFMLWYFTIYIVTDQRIRQITQRGFFGKDVVELRLSKVQNISYKIPGFSGEVFKFGTIVIQTFVGDLVINMVEHPDKIYNKLQDAVNNVIDDRGENEEIIS